MHTQSEGKTFQDFEKTPVQPLSETIPAGVVGARMGEEGGGGVGWNGCGGC